MSNRPSLKRVDDDDIPDLPLSSQASLGEGLKIVDEVLTARAHKEMSKTWALGAHPSGEYNVRITREDLMFSHCEGSIHVLRSRSGEVLWQRESWRDDKGGFSDKFAIHIDQSCEIRITIKAHHFISGMVQVGSSKVRVIVTHCPDDAPPLFPSRTSVGSSHGSGQSPAARSPPNPGSATSLISGGATPIGSQTIGSGGSGMQRLSNNPIVDPQPWTIQNGVMVANTSQGEPGSFNSSARQSFPYPLPDDGAASGERGVCSTRRCLCFSRSEPDEADSVIQ